MWRVTEAVETVDVLVVGLGPAGAASAAAAARAGARVLAVDRRQEVGVPVQCAEFVPTLIGQAMRGLSAARTQDILGMTTFLPHEIDVQETFRGTMIDRRAFDAGLVRDAEAAGAACRFGVAVRAIDADGCVAMHGRPSVEARVIVGADGPRSRVGAAVGRTNTSIAETRQIVVPLATGCTTTDIFLSADIVGGYGWLFPSGGIANLGVGVDAARRADLKSLLDDLRATLMAEGRIDADILRHTGGAIPVGGALDPVARLAATHVLLAGDAAGLTNPITGAGIAAAVQSGVLAGVAAARIASGDITAAAGYAEDIDDLFGASLARAVERRRDLMATHARRHVTSGDLRRAWIAFPEYWSATRPPAPADRAAETSSHVLSEA